MGERYKTNIFQEWYFYPKQFRKEIEMEVKVLALRNKNIITGLLK
jgi:hypothetical protein